MSCCVNLRPVALFLVIPALFTGCGGDAVTTVSGAISYKGKPVTAGLINFQPAQGKTLGGAINSDGSYSFEMPPGEYQVLIDAPGQTPAWKEGDPEPKPTPRLAPEKYANYSTSGLTASVTAGGSQTIDYKLQ